MQVARRVLRTAFIAGLAVGLPAGGSVLALASGPAAQAATACAAAWSAKGLTRKQGAGIEIGSFTRAGLRRLAPARICL